ncbi:hypothetical protein [Cupriavidus taiwanensis]|uniref:hypothetical protein n=1 Tax=Cupriavidus taiwanensis TaxID=164546 RepID=UPI000E104507|nr:hypothetical protein [Cupriavidus taiwanensis]SPD61708.1 protein of unknown function [Cupriavidus taiwanensis]
MKTIAAIWFPPEFVEPEEMEIKARVAASSKNYSKEFRTQVVAETLDPASSLQNCALAWPERESRVEVAADYERAATSASSLRNYSCPFR